MYTLTEPEMQAELEELAVLDAWGLLSGEDLSRFEAAFAIEGPEQRARLRAIQDSCSAGLNETWLQAPADLKQRVLQRLQATRDLEGLQLHTARFATAAPRPGRSAGIWRMAALILLAVSMTMVIMHQATRAQYDKLLDEYTVLQALRTIEVDLDADQQANFIAMMRRPDVRHVYVAADNGAGLVRFAIDETTGEAFVLAMDLAGRTAPCVLELETSDGDIIVLASLRTDRYIDAHHFELDPALLDGGTLRLREADGTVIGSTLA
jgi:hypothetical protein